MTAHRWQQIKGIFESAIEYSVDERDAYLARVCGEDRHLRSEIESLLASHREASNFLADPPRQLAEAALQDCGTLAAGRQVGQYAIIAPIGRGGMGEVYLAKDLRLDRKVAIKTLPSIYTADEERVRRFEREAKTASALNHPNILMIFDVGRSEQGHFIAMEFVEGETLRAILSRQQLELIETLNISLQIAGALQAAHSAGIVHRDIKPENIMVRPDGYIKVLDFGLAKLGDTREPSIEGTAADVLPAVPALSHLTMAGAVMGTPDYMSPEQARGIAVDSRSDIFSFGVVLFEMLAGSTPFQGKSPSDLTDPISNADQPPFVGSGAEIPAELQTIVLKSLRKEPIDRYQTIEEMIVPLRALKQKLEWQGADSTRGDDTDPHLQSPSSLHRKRRLLFAVFVGLLLLLAGGMILLSDRRQGRNEPPPAQSTVPENPAQQLYVRGRYNWNMRSAESLRLGIDYFEQAIAQDRTFAPAWAGLADCYSLLPGHADVLPLEAFGKARAAADRAVELDDGLAEAHAALGLALRDGTRDFQGAEKEFHRAIELNPNLAVAWQWRAENYVFLNRIPDAMEAMARAQQIDSFSLSINTGIGWMHLQAREYSRAIELLQRSLQFDRGFAPAHLYLAIALEQRQRFDEAIVAAREAVRLSKDEALSMASLAHIYASSRKKNEALALLRQLEGRSRRGHISAFARALIYTGLNENQRALDWLQTAFDEHDPSLLHSLRDPRLDPLRTDKRFRDLVSKLDLAP